MTSSLWEHIIIAGSTLLASILGFTFAGRNDARRDRRATDREERTRVDDRRSAAVQLRHEFQLETLLALQDAVQLMARLTGRTMHFDHMQARASRYTQLPHTYDEEMLANGVNVIRLRNRVLDQRLRAAIEHFESQSTEAVLAHVHYMELRGEGLEAAALGHLSAYNAAVEQVMEHVGIALRAELDWRPA